MPLKNEAAEISVVLVGRMGVFAHLVRRWILAEPGVPVYPEDHVFHGQLGDREIQPRQGGGETFDERFPVLEGPTEFLVMGYFMSAKPLRWAGTRTFQP